MLNNASLAHHRAHLLLLLFQLLSLELLLL
jgi:hypothetical protein